MTDGAHEPRRDAAGEPDPWAPPERKTSLSKSADAPASAHDQPTVAAMPGTEGFAPPQGLTPPGFGPAGGPSAGPADGAVPPPPIAPTGPGASGYGYPGYPGYGWSGMPMAPQNGLGVAAMVLGIISVCLFCFYGVVSVILGILALVFGIKGRKRVERGEADNPGQAQAGFILGIIGTVLGVLVIVLLAIGITAAIKGHSYDDSYDGARAVPSVVADR
ncbi:DUF4190 domain-containing protein [Streptomyces sp. NPDC002004]